MKEMRDVVVVGYLRTAQSRSRPADPARDVFGQLRADDLLAQVLPEVLERSRVSPEEVDDFLVGAAVGVNENWSYGGRYPIFLANLPHTIPAKFVDQQCGSTMAGISPAGLVLSVSTTLRKLAEASPATTRWLCVAMGSTTAAPTRAL